MTRYAFLLSCFIHYDVQSILRINLKNIRTQTSFEILQRLLTTGSLLATLEADEQRRKWQVHTLHLVLLAS